MKIKNSVFLAKKIGDPSEKDNPILMKESIGRFPTYAFESHDLFLDGDTPKAKVHRLSVDKHGNLVAGLDSILDLSDECLVNVRLDPPFNIKYITALHILSKVGPHSYVTNSPHGILNMPEKIIPHDLAPYIPATLVTHSEEEIIKFWKKHKDIVVKPLYEYGGKSVFRLKPGEENYRSIIAAILESYNEQVVAQKFIPEVKKGDKRIILIEGNIVGQALRVPAKGQLQASVTLGGSINRTTLTPREKEICKKLKPILLKNDIFLCGIDIIGDYLTEINVTCPAIAFLLNHANKGVKNYIPAEKIFWDSLETKVKKLTFPK
jgi:glutathione synthase